MCTMGNSRNLPLEKGEKGTTQNNLTEGNYSSYTTSWRTPDPVLVSASTSLRSSNCQNLNLFNIVLKVAVCSIYY